MGIRGRIPNSIKKRAKEEIAESGCLAHHYAVYNVNWSNPSKEDLQLVRAIEIIQKGDNKI